MLKTRAEGPRRPWTETGKEETHSNELTEKDSEALSGARAFQLGQGLGKVDDASGEGDEVGGA